MTQITAAKETRLVMHSPNCKWSLGTTVLARVWDITSLVKPLRQNTLGRKNRETVMIVDKNRKPKTTLEKTHKLHKTAN